MHGTVRRFDVQKGYGFLSTPDGDLYFHVSAIQFGAKVATGDPVTFDVVPDQKSGRNKAINVRLVA
jgi:cold shock CspA family protein